ncbi:hypothetical protein AGMMS49546_04640 [Spirochaetia bacterium]|nr:hypothetical protein AGMMS49546_04640 [Spirochaetia bacterium]
MPSLHALQDFKTSFNLLGGELAAFEAQHIPFDDLALPEKEAVAPPPKPAPEAEPADTAPAEPFVEGPDWYANLPDLPETNAGLDLGGSDDLSGDFESGGSAAPAEGSADAASEAFPVASDEDFDFGAFLNTIPDDLAVPDPVADLPDMAEPAPEESAAEEPAVEEPAAGTEAAGADDFGIPDDLLNGLADDVESSTPDTGTDEAAGESADLSGLDDFNIPGLEDSDTATADAGDGPDLGGEAEPPDLGDELDLGDDAFDLGTESPAEGMDGSADLPDLNDFDIPGLEDSDSDTATADTGDGLDSGGEAEPPDLGDESFDLGGDAFDLGSESPAEGVDDSADLPGLDDFNIPGLEDSDTATADAGDGLDLGGEAESPDLGDESFDLGDDAFDLGSESPAEGGDESADLPGLDDFNIPGLDDAAGEDMDFGSEFSDMDLSAGENDAQPLMGGPEDTAEIPEEFSGDGADDDFGPVTDAAGSPFGDMSADAFDDFNLEGGDKLPDDFSAESAKGPGAGGSDGGGENEFPDLDDFTLPGIDDVIAGIPPTGSPAPGAKPKKGAAAAARIPGVAASDDVEEIQLSAGDLAKFQKTLSGYPLNLRIACEELIAEQAVVPDQMSQLVKLLIRGAPAKETAALAGKILGRTIAIPRGFEKKTGEELEAEQASFAYIFVHNFLPVLRIFLMIAVVAASLFYLVYHFIYTPLRAESLYKIGYDRIENGEYERANDRFTQAFGIHPVKNWFYKYAEGFRDQRQYRYAEGKYDELLRYYPRDKKGVLDYAALETNYLRNYEKADSLLRRNILDYAVNDPEALLALGDNALAWGETDPSKYEDARFAYARLLDRYGWTDPVAERMLKYFIRTDNLKEVLPLQSFFMDYPKRKISADSLAELGGYLLDKRVEEVRGVPNEYVEQIEEVREVLLKTVQIDPALPEGHYHLSRYYRNLNNLREEQVTLEAAIGAFDRAKEESIKRLGYRIDAQRRYAGILTGDREFFAAEEQLIKGIGLYEDGLTRRLLTPSAEYGKLYADLGDLVYFTKAGDMELALQYYLRSEQDGWAPPEIQYRMGSAYYHQEQWTEALERFFAASSELPLNRRILLALGNVSYQRGNYFAAQGYYNRLLDILEGERSRLPQLLPNERPEYVDLAERLMIARNNMGVTLEALSRSMGNVQPRVLDRYRSRALGFYTESARAWDTLTRNPTSMVRLGAGDFSTPGINLAFLNSRNALYPVPDYEPQLYLQIDKDVLEPSAWEALSPQTARLTE